MDRLKAKKTTSFMILQTKQKTKIRFQYLQDNFLTFPVWLIT